MCFQVQTTLAVIEEERDRFMTKLLNEEKTRKSLEGMLVVVPLSCVTFEFKFFPCLSLNIPSYIAPEQHQELEHAIGSLKSEKSQVENQLKMLQQKNEIMVEMYQQKENALQQ